MPLDAVTLGAAQQYAREVSGAVDVEAAQQAAQDAQEAQTAAEAAAEIAQDYGFELTLTENQDGTYTLEKDGSGTPGEGVTDVQVNGVSVVDDGVAEITLDPVVTVSGTTPTINAAAGTRYVCGEVATLDVALPAAGIVDVVFKSGSTATILTVTPPTGVTVSWPAWFNSAALEANSTYEINIMDGLGAVMVWA